MKNYLFKFTRRSLIHYSKDYLNQVIIIAILASIITGSLLTGDSVRKSLVRNSREKLGNTYILVSSGLRFFDSSISERFKHSYEIKSVPLLETFGYCQNFSTGATALNINIYGITKDFFDFHGINGIEIAQGTVAINSELADHLGVAEGDEIIIRFREADPIPENAPFAPEGKGESSKVLKISRILESEKGGNFSLGISQIIPQNIFINIADLQSEKESSFKINRLLVAYNEKISESIVNNALTDLLVPSDIGLSIRKSEVTGETEIISDRIFIDSTIVNKIIEELNQGYPVITYLANSIKASNAETPYSFVSGIPFRGETSPGDREIIISKWLANDLHAVPGDEVTLKWYHPVGNLLEETEKSFRIKKIAGDDNIFSDPSLMPEFPGISGSTSCSSWDAGIPILMDKIRDKDEDYWNTYKGTPKAFVSYKNGKKMWGNNFGPATAIRFPADTGAEIILNALKGKIIPSDAGFTVSDVMHSGEQAANKGVDFGTLFLSLGFFIILSSIILLSFSVSIFFDSKKEQIRTYFSLGFRNKVIGRMLFNETLLIALAGALTGIFLGYGVNLLIIYALNSVWTGAVQTNTISPGFNLMSVITGFVSTIIIAQMMVMLRLRNFLKRLVTKGEKGFKLHSPVLNLILLLLFAVPAIIIIMISWFSEKASVLLSFSAGTLLFISLILSFRQYYLSGLKRANSLSQSLYSMSKRFYSFYPSQAVTPVVFIAAGIFAIIITGSNRLVLTDKMLMNEGGTGGYLLWSESAIPVKENMNTEAGRIEFGLNDPELKDIEILQGLKLAGDDASCLNLNHIKAPPLLGINPEEFVRRGSFSFATVIKNSEEINPWILLTEKAGENAIYGIADQTVLQWGMMVKTGDTLMFRSENGRLLKIVICGGLKSSIFQGHLLIGDNFFREYFPSVPGSSVFLFDKDTPDTDNLISILSDRFSNYGLAIETASEKLSSFFVVTNTYLNVFTILGMLGLILGVFGLGFMLIRNYEQRKKEFALLMAAGYKSSRISAYIIIDQLIVLVWGIITGTVSAIIATLPSLRNSDVMSYKLLLIMIIAILLTGLAILYLSVNKVKRTNLLDQIRKD
ncbi:MAG TPA: ABC transporter permease [Bacteroidales bacterium]|nr:ABC transporter permease [Bacteroidales bacterium]